MKIMIPDKDYPRIFHSPGLEPWVLGLLLMIRPSSMLDVGCGYGYWGFITRRRVNSLSYVVGLDTDLQRLKEAKLAYDDLILADAKHLPFRTGSLDIVLAVEVLHGFDERCLSEVLRAVKIIARMAVIATFPQLSGETKSMLKKHSFKLYRYLMRGFMLIGDDVLLMYETRLFKFLKVFTKLFYMLMRLSKFFREGYHIAIYLRCKP